VIDGIESLMPDFSGKQRQNLADKGQAMPGGGYPIRNRADLQRAIQAFGRAKNPTAAKAWIIKRARALNAMDLLPETWSESVRMSEESEELLVHIKRAASGKTLVQGILGDTANVPLIDLVKDR
jgi:hypothetical protein